MLFYTSHASAFLLALPPGEDHLSLLERVLITFDPLSETQTVISQALIKGSPSSFAVLIATPKNVDIHYTTTSIWRNLRAHIHPKEIQRRTLNLKPYSWFLNQIIPSIKKVKIPSRSQDVLKSKETTIHEEECKLHQWLLRRGLSLTASQALSVKDVYANGQSLATLLVTPRRKLNKQRSAQETWTSTWIFTSKAKYPHYWIVNSRPVHLRLSTPSPPPSLEITLLTEWPAHPKWFQEKAYKSSLQFSDPSSLYKEERIKEERMNPSSSLDKSPPLLSQHSPLSLPLSPPQLMAIRSLSRGEVNTLNAKLKSTMWSFKRQGVLSHFKITPSHGVLHLSLVKSERQTPFKQKAVIKERVHQFLIPLELIGLLLYLLWWLWFKYANER